MNVLLIVQEAGLITIMIVYDPQLSMIKKVFWDVALVQDNVYSEGDIFLARINKKLGIVSGYFVDFKLDRGLLSSYQNLNVGDVVPVQVKRLSNPVKGALLTGVISIRYGAIIIVLNQANKKQLAFGNKLPKSRIQHTKQWFRKHLLNLGSCIVRSSSLNKTNSELLFDYRMCLLLNYYYQREVKRVPQEVKRIVKISRIEDFLQQEIYKVTKVYGNVNILNSTTFQYQRYINPDVRKKLVNMTSKKIYLNNHVSLYIEKTELGWNIDVNSGRTDQENLLKVNLSCVKTIFEQIFLRNMNGFILIDFVNLNTVWEKVQLEEMIRNYSLLDSLKMRFNGLDENYLAILVRQNLGQALSPIEGEVIDIFLECYQLRPEQKFSISFKRWNDIFSTPNRMLHISRFLVSNRIKLHLTLT